jgi:hypothetical protein
MAISLFKFALLFIIVLLIYQVIIQTLIYLRQKKKSSFGATTDITLVLPNEKNVIYMIIQNPYTATTLTNISSSDKINQFNKSVVDLQQFKKDLITDIYSVDNFIKSVLVNYNYTFDNSVTTLVDFSKESLVKSFDLASKMWGLCGTKTYKDAFNYLLSDSVLFTMYMDVIRKKNIVLDGQANNPVIADASSSVVVSPNWGLSVRYVRGANPYGTITPFPSNAIQAFGFQRNASISQNVKLSQKTYVLSTFVTARIRDGTGDNSPSGMYVFNDTTKPTQLVKANPIEVSLSLTKTTTSTVTKTPTTTTTDTTTASTTTSTAPTTTTSTSVSKNGLQTLITTTTTIVEDATKIVTTVTTVTKSIVGIIIPKNSYTWQQDLFTFDVPEENTYSLSFTSTWSASDRTSFLTDIILSDVTPFDFPPVDYGCKKPAIDTKLKYITSSRDSDIQDILSYYGVVEKMSITGNDISNSVVLSLTQCKNLCDVNNLCAGFVMENTTNKCYLKSNADSVNSVKSDISTLYKKKPSSTYSQFANKNAVGNDLFNIPNATSDITVCTNACDLTPGCKAYVFDKTGKRCYIKSDIGTTTDSTSTDIYSKDATINTKLTSTTTTTASTTTTTASTTPTTTTTASTTPTTSTTTTAKFTNSRTGKFGNVVEKFGVVTDWTDNPVNPYLNSYVIFSDNSYGFVMADGKVRRFGDKSRIVKEIQGKNGCPMLEHPNYYTWWAERYPNSFKKLPYTSLSSAPVYDPPLTEGPPLNNGDSCFVDGTKITYTNNYAAPIKDLNHIEFDVGTASGTVKTVDQCKTECNNTTGCVGFIYETATQKCYPKSYLNLPRGLRSWSTSNGNVIEASKGFDMYRREAKDQNGKDVTNATEVNPFLNKMLFQSGINNYYVQSDGKYNEKLNYYGNGTCPNGRYDDGDGNVGSVKWMAKSSDYSKLQFYSPPLVFDSTKKLGEYDVCAIRGKNNPFFKQYIRMKSGTMYYVTDDATMRKVPTWYVLDSVSGKNGCPLSTDYIQLDTDDYNYINFTYEFKPPLKLGKDLVFGDYCVAPTSNPYLGKIIQYSSGSYAYITTLGLVRNIPTTDILNSIAGKNGCPLTTAIQKVNTDDYNALGVFTPPLLPGTDMTYNDYCTGFTPILTDVTKLKLQTVTAPEYKTLYFDNSIKINEIYLCLNGQYLKLTTDMTSEQRKSALYEFITKNYF